jgi:uncharacterized protein (TIGR02001 family)
MKSNHHFVLEQHNMKSVFKTGLAASLVLASATASADWSTNLGFASDYYYRGIFQASSSANGGIDYENNGFFAGTWAADVGDGLEVDLFGGYGFSAGSVDLSVGYTGYFYSGDFDDTYQEINLGAAAGLFSLDVAVGRYDNFDGPTLDYTFYSLTFEKNGFYGKVGGFAQDFEGEYIETGYGTSVSDIDLGVALIFANSDLVGESEESIVFTIGKSFDL